MKHVHVIPVLPGTTVDETWAELRAIGFLDPPAPEDCHWGQVHCNGDECRNIQRKANANA